MKIKPVFFVSAIILGSLAVNLWGISHDMPYCYEHDEINFVVTALGFGKGNLNPGSFNHGSFLYYFLFLEYIIFYCIKAFAGNIKSGADFISYYINNPESFFMIGRISCALLATFSVFLTYLAGKKLVNRLCGSLAAMFLAFSLLFVNMAHLIKEDIFYVFFLLLSFLCVLNTEKNRKLFFLAAFLTGVAASSKYLAALGIIFVLSGFFTQKKPLKETVKGLVLISFFMLFGFFICQPYALLQIGHFLRNILDLKGHIYDTPIGDNPCMAWRVYLGYLYRTMGMPLLTVSALSFLLIFKRSCHKISLLILPYILIYFFFISSAVNVLPNYIMGILPFICIYAAVFMAKAAAKISARPQNTVIFAALGCLLVLPSFVNVLRYDCLLTKPDTRAVSKAWIEKNIPQNAVILIEGAFPWKITQNPPLLENKECLKEELRKILERGGSGVLWKARISEPDKKVAGYFLKKEGHFNKYTQLSSYNPDYVVVSSFYDHGFWVSKSDRQLFYNDLLKNYSLIKNFKAMPYIVWFPSFCTLRENPGNLRYVNILSSDQQLVAGPNISIYQSKLRN